MVEVGIIISRVWLSGKTYQLPVKRYCVEVLGNAFSGRCNGNICLVDLSAP